MGRACCCYLWRCMDNEKEIVARVDNDLIYHHFFDYVKDETLPERIRKNLSLAVGFYEKNANKLLFCAIYDTCENTLHVREVGGNFLKYSVYLDIFSQGLAKFFSRDSVTLNTYKRSIRKMAYKLGFLEQSDGIEFLKRVI
jgi:hypothetical protein